MRCLFILKQLNTFFFIEIKTKIEEEEEEEANIM